MKLTKAEFNMIRPLQWTLQNHGDKVYNTITNQDDIQLFWLDFLRLIFAPKFKQQVGVTYISEFDQTQPVLLTDDLQLTLPTQLETAVYFANNSESPPMEFKFNIAQRTVLIITIIIICLIVVLEMIFGKKLQFDRMI